MRWLTSLLLACFLAFAAMPAVAQPSLDQAVRMVKQRTDGRILSADTVRRGNRLVHRIKVLTPDGRVRVVEIPAGRVNNGDGGPGRR